MRNKIIIGFVLLALAGGLMAFYMFNKKVPSLENIKSDFALTANELFDAFNLNEEEALLKYENKVLEVTGKIVSIKQGEVSTNIILFAEDAMAGGINCSTTNLVSDISKGQNIKIKGRCQGFLMDVVLNNCIVYE